MSGSLLVVMSVNLPPNLGNVLLDFRLILPQTGLNGVQLLFRVDVSLLVAHQVDEHDLHGAGVSLQHRQQVLIALVLLGDNKVVRLFG